jgi:hypothetical protein
VGERKLNDGVGLGTRKDCDGVRLGSGTERLLRRFRLTLSVLLIKLSACSGNY